MSLRGPVVTTTTSDIQSLGRLSPMGEWQIERHGEVCGGSKVAVIDVDGLMVNRNLMGPYSAGDNPVALFCEKLQAAEADPAVCAVVVRISSPGGGVTASDLMWKQLLDFRRRSGRPVIACLMEVGTGGAYYLATAADEIYALPNTVTGGIGAIYNQYNLQVMMENFNIFAEPIKAGKNIDMGTALAPMSEETRQWLQGMVDQYYRRFVQVVISRRPATEHGDPSTFDGRVFTAEQALSRGLIDRVGYLEDAIEAARTRAGKAGAKVVMYHRSNDPARTLYAITPNDPSANRVIPMSVPGAERSRLPAFLYLWQVEPTLEAMGR